jgi:hypothetical protein
MAQAQERGRVRLGPDAIKPDPPVIVSSVKYTFVLKLSSHNPYCVGGYSHHEH